MVFAFLILKGNCDLHIQIIIFTLNVKSSPYMSSILKLNPFPQTCFHLTFPLFKTIFN